jgi:2-polyprenyl-3-methyl-5-hydroxy-6-metoxy-1,4-benzoquinol methylase
MNPILRNQDVVTGNEDLDLMYSFKNFPVFMGCVDQPKEQDLVSDLNIYISRSSGMLQINPVLPLEVVYQTEHNPGTTGQSWLDHHQAFAQFISTYEPKKVFEIGGAHGILSEYCADINADIEWTILEPNPVPVNNLRATMQKGFFTDVNQIPAGTDTIVHSHVFEHVYDPKDFTSKLSQLPVGTKVFFSIPDLKNHLANNFTNTLNFEHTYFCTTEFAAWFMGCYGFDLLDKQEYGAGHSIFFACVKSDRAVEFWDFPEAYDDNKMLWENYVSYHEAMIQSINTQIAHAPGKVYLFGAHVFSQFLLSFGLDRSKIECIIDNSSLKQGKRLYGTDLTVYNPSILKDEVSPTVILRTGVFNAEIKQDILTNINSGTIFLE